MHPQKIDAPGSRLAGKGSRSYDHFPIPHKEGPPVPHRRPITLPMLLFMKPGKAVKHLPDKCHPLRDILQSPMRNLPWPAQANPGAFVQTKSQLQRVKIPIPFIFHGRLFIHGLKNPRKCLLAPIPGAQGNLQNRLFRENQMPCRLGQLPPSNIIVNRDTCCLGKHAVQVEFGIVNIRCHPVQIQPFLQMGFDVGNRICYAFNVTRIHTHPLLYHSDKFLCKI